MTTSAAQRRASAPAAWPGHPEIEPHEPGNLFLLALHQIVFRIGWVFKTESVIIPAFLDTVSGAGWLRGCLPVLTRFGQSLPPLLWAERLKGMGYKKRALAAFTLLMSVPFGLLSLVWLRVGARPPAWMPGLFLALYFAFFVANGLYQLCFGTVQGKPFLFSPAVGWLVDATSFELVFLCTACLIVLGGYMTFRLDEPRHRLRRVEVEPVSAAGGV